LTGASWAKYAVHANHSLRRAYSTAARQAGVDEDVIKKLLNHGGKKLIDRYIKHSHLGRMHYAPQRDVSGFINK
jgi:hypothetical protein